MAFNLENFKAGFTGRLENLKAADKVVREELRTLSRDVLFALHEHGDITYINKLIACDMTPVNRKRLVEFFQEFSGFIWNKEAKQFLKKNKAIIKTDEGEVPSYDIDKAKALSELENEAFDFWVWAVRDKDSAPSEFDLAKVTTAVAGFKKKANKAGVTDRDLMKAIIAGGLDVETLLDVLAAM